MIKSILNNLSRLVNGLIRRIILFYWSLRLNKIGHNVVIDRNVKIYGPENIVIGDNTTINSGVILQSCQNGKIEIGKNVTISYNTIILTCGLNLPIRPPNKTHFSKDVLINDGVWIGVNVTILPGVSIQSNSVVAAGSVVTKDLPANGIYGGIPAKLIRSINDIMD